MGKHSFLGPIDPQLILQTPLGVQVVPAQAILDQFKKAQEECRNPQALGSWLPILSQYGPALLVQCDNAIKLSQELVTSWLNQYMFGGRDADRAKRIADALSSHGVFKSHGRHISLQAAKEMGLVVEALELSHSFQEHVLSLFHATMHTFSGTTAVKIIENHLGRAFIKSQQQAIIPQPSSPPAQWTLFMWCDFWVLAIYSPLTRVRRWHPKSRSSSNLNTASTSTSAATSYFPVLF